MFNQFKLLIKSIKLILAILILFNLTSCYSTENCQSLDNLYERSECERNIQEKSQVEVLTNLFSFGFIGMIFYLLAIKSPGFLRFTHSALKTADVLLEGQSKEPVQAALDELLKLTGAYFDGYKNIFQEVRPQDKHRIKELCEFILKQENFEEKVEILNALATSLEEQEKDSSTISKLRKMAEEQRILGQSISDLLKRATA
ncbi:hypothetical protein ACE1AT_20340 [Pelatocladus sp. BLCC-F211]|uniref:hypothetical protein n=1 Tax=Pelatocladus sp. BLCC-F211 TaxID=3342752 RepID=UPI0035B96DDC